MPRNRNPNRIKAFEIYKESKGKKTSKEIASMLNEKDKNIEYWRTSDNWSSKYNPEGGAPLGNKNACGHGAPEENQNARKFGWYSKYMPTQTINIIKELEESHASTLDILWAQITTQYAAIIRAQKIMFVESKEEMIKEVKKHKEYNKSHKSKTGTEDNENSSETEWDFQFAWDREATFLNAQSRAMGTLRSLIRQYEEMLKDVIATEEQKLRIEKLKTNIINTKEEFKSRNEIAKQKLQLEKERLEHTKKMDELKNF